MKGKLKEIDDKIKKFFKKITGIEYFEKIDEETKRKKTLRKQTKKKIKLETYNSNFKLYINKHINITQIMVKIIAVIMCLYVSGTILSAAGDVINGTTNPFFNGLSLIGWNVTPEGTITGTNNTSILAAISIIGIGWILTEIVGVRAS